MLLLPLTPMYEAVVRTRAAAYRRGLLRIHRLDVPVVSVGNLTFGGTGKTPTVVALARDLARRDRRPAILTRGYGRAHDRPVIMVGPPDGTPVELVGDEPLEMAARLPGVPIVVDADRARGGRTAVEAGADVVLLDDGFQHLRLARDLDLVLVDAGDPWGGDRLPPRGRLREPASALRRATAVLVTKVGGTDDPVVAAVADRVTDIAGQIPVFAAGYRVTRVRTGDGWQPPHSLEGRRVMAVAGLGRPEGFRRLLEESGAEVVASRWFADHHRYTGEELRTAVEEAAAREAVVVTTGKDAVKLPGDSPVWVVEVDMEPVDGTWDALWRLLPGGGP